MKGCLLKIRLVACAMLLTGCNLSSHTRLPTLAASDPRAERNSYEYYDPIPERETAPTVERPRGFERERSLPTRANERRAQVMPWSDGLANPSAARYPNSVSP